MKTPVSAPGDQQYALKRYVNETRRLYRTMDKALAQNPSGFLVGDHLTIADIAIWPWTTAFSKSSTTRCYITACWAKYNRAEIKRATEYSGLSQIDEFPHVKDWMYRLLARPGFERGRNVPSPHIYLQLNELPDEELRKIGRERSGWILEVMEKDAE